MITQTQVQEELKKIESSLISNTLIRERYLELYAVQQALSWVLDSELFAAPYEVVMSGKVQFPSSSL